MKTLPFTKTFLTADELAAYFRVSTRTLRRWRHNQAGPSWARVDRERQSGPIVYFKSDIQKYMDSLPSFCSLAEERAYWAARASMRDEEPLPPPDPNTLLSFGSRGDSPTDKLPKPDLS